MPSSSMLLVILDRTPPWVWVLLVALTAAGVAQSRPRRVALARVTVLPVAFVGVSLSGVVGALGSAESVAGWALGLVTAAALGVAVGAPSAARWHAAERRFDVPGSWLPLALMLGLFATKFAVAVLVARSPGLRHVAAFASAAGLAYGAFSGLFLGRALALRVLRAQADRPAAVAMP